SGTHQWSWSKDYIYRDSSLLGTAASAPNHSEIHTHFHLDHLGSPRMITDDGGNRLAFHTYLPFGAEAPGSEIDNEQMKFTGHERDFDTLPDRTLDYMHARYYAALGRFLSFDPGHP